jgi:hypothetical protein
MDVILDSNVLTPNFRMRGAEFRSLYDYLNRTDSYLVIPQIVLQETLANYSRLLRERITVARRALEQLKGIVFETRIPVELGIDIPRQSELLRQRLCPSEDGVNQASRIKTLTEYPIATVEQVMKRGIERMPPATDRGEELRDVVVWMSVMEYCKSGNNPVAFISTNRKQFATDDGKNLHPSLSAEAKAANLTIHFHPTIGSFLASHSPKAVKIDEQNAYKLVSRERVEEMLSQALVQSIPTPYRGSRTATASLMQLYFRQGMRYEVGSNTAYCELEFSGWATLKVRETPYFGGGFDSKEKSDAWMRGELDFLYEHTTAASIELGIRLANEAVTDVGVNAFWHREYPEYMGSNVAGLPRV